VLKSAVGIARRRGRPGPPAGGVTFVLLARPGLELGLTWPGAIRAPEASLGQDLSAPALHLGISLPLGTDPNRVRGE